MLDQAIQALIEKEKGKIPSLGGFRVVKYARDLINPSRERGEHHRSRENFWTSELERAERKLREEGVSVEVFDPGTGLTSYASVCSGAIASGNLVGNQAQFQPRIDQKLLDAVKHAKNKMLEHRNRAELYEKYLRIFSVAPPNSPVELNIEDVEFFRLEA